jgi:predicted nucleic acid-binding protein
MPAKKRNVLDSFALLAFLNRERGFEKVRSLLRGAAAARDPVFMNEINIGEVYYVTARYRSSERADEVLRRLETLPIQPVGNSLTEVVEAARLKARLPVSCADAFAVATAVRMDAVLVTGDRDLRQVEHLVEIDWL